MNGAKVLAESIDFWQSFLSRFGETIMKRQEELRVHGEGGESLNFLSATASQPEEPKSGERAMACSNLAPLPEDHMRSRRNSSHLKVDSHSCTGTSLVKRSAPISARVLKNTRVVTVLGDPLAWIALSELAAFASKVRSILLKPEDFLHWRPKHLRVGCTTGVPVQETLEADEHRDAVDEPNPPVAYYSTRQRAVVVQTAANAANERKGGITDSSTLYEELASTLRDVAAKCEEAVTSLMRSGRCDASIDELARLLGKACLPTRADCGQLWTRGAAEWESLQHWMSGLQKRLDKITDLELPLRLGDVDYRLREKIGEGSFGVVFKAEPLCSDGVVAIKFERRNSDNPQLLDEWRAYRLLSNCGVTPRVRCFARDVVLHNVLVMDLLGPSLDRIFEAHHRNFTSNIIAAIMIRVIGAIKLVHDHEYTHCDVKPENILRGGQNTDSDELYIVDFGFAVRRQRQGPEVPTVLKSSSALVGTPRYMSARAHRGEDLSYRDDMVSAIYMGLLWAKGRLPWQGQLGDPDDKIRRIGKIKESMTPNALASGIGGDLEEAFKWSLEHVSGLDFNERPDYQGLRQRFGRAVTGGDEQCVQLTEHLQRK